MNIKFMSASALSAALLAGGALAPLQAGHATGHAHFQMPHSMAHYGPMQQQQRQGDTARLGVAIVELDQADLDQLSLEYGVRVEKVLQGSVAEAAGIQPGDLITAINDWPAYSPERLQYLTRGASGATTVTISRNGEALQLDAQFAAPPNGNAMLGVRLQEMTDELKEAFGSQGDAGVLISQVVAGSPAKQAGLKAGDVIVNLGKDDIRSVRDIKAALRAYAPGDKVDVAYVRDREQRSMQVELGGSEPSPHAVHASPPHWMPGHGAGGHGGWSAHRHYGQHGMTPHEVCRMGKDRMRT